MKIIFLTLISLLLLVNLVLAQKQVKFFTNSQEIDENRYEGVKGSPYLFKNWMTAVLVDDNDSVYNDVKLNFNGYEGDFEVLNNEKFIALDEQYYKNVKVKTDQGEVLFQKELHPKNYDIFYQVVYKSERVTCFIDYSVGIIENKINGNMGTTTIFKKFKADPMHHIIINGSLQSARLTKSKLSKILGRNKTLNSYIKKNNLKFSSAFDLSKIMKFFEDNILK